MRTGKVSKAGYEVEKYLKHHYLDDVYTFMTIQTYWPVIVNEQLAKKTAPAKLEKRTLIVKVVDSAYAHHLKYMVKRILEYIDPICGEGRINNIRFIVGEIPEREPIVEQVEEERVSTFANSSPEDLRKSEKLSKNFENNHLKFCFKKAYLKSIKTKL